jgi:predicted ATP-grasp superfamily ATP-dependent carboligase
VIDTSVPVAVIDRDGYGGVSIARTLGRLGVPMYLVAQEGFSTPGSSSRYWVKRVRWDFSGPEEESVAFVRDFGAGIRTDHGTRAILLTQKDWVAIFVERNSKTLREQFLLPEPLGPVIRNLLDKWEMHLLAQEHGIPTPATARPTSPDDAGEFIESAGLPIVVKEADRYGGDQGSTTLTHTRQELMDEIGHRQRDGGPLNVVLQEYIPGGVDTVWMCNGYFAPTRAHTVIFTGRKLRQLWETGIASLAICLPNEAVATQTQRFMEGVGYRGCVGIGYRYDRRDGLYKVLDVNPRVSGVFRLFVGTNDVDVVRACYLDLTGQQLPTTSLQPGRKWLLEDHVFFADRTGLRSDHRRIAEWIRSVRGVQELHWFAADDPVPGVMWLRVLFPWLARLGLDAVKRVRRRPDDHAAPADQLQASVPAAQLQAVTERETELRDQLDQARTTEAELRRLLDQTRGALDESEASLQAIRQTRAWRLITGWWRLKRRLTRHW